MLQQQVRRFVKSADSWKATAAVSAVCMKRCCSGSKIDSVAGLARVQIMLAKPKSGGSGHESIGNLFRHRSDTRARVPYREVIRQAVTDLRGTYAVSGPVVCLQRHSRRVCCTEYSRGFRVLWTEHGRPRDCGPSWHSSVCFLLLF